MNDNRTIFAKNKTLDDLEGEEWRNVRQNQYYYISRNHHQMKILAQQKNDSGYWRVCMSLEKGCPKYYLVSRLVVEAFAETEMDEKIEVHHKEGKDNNTVGSLACLSKEEHNQEHKRLKEQKRAETYGEKQLEDC